MSECIAGQRDAARKSQAEWFQAPLRKRLEVVGGLAHLIAREHGRLAELIDRPNANYADKLASEIIPLADACRYTARRGFQVLAPRSLPRHDNPRWLGHIGVTVHREPWGLVLVIAPRNYPLFLPAVQMIQAIAAGNGVLVKAAPDCDEVLSFLARLLVDCGMLDGLVQILPTSVEAASTAISQGVDKVLVTGSNSTGRKVAERLVEHLTPATMELSGCDPVFVLPDADLTRLADALAFGLRLNGGATCMAPRRVYIASRQQDQLEPLLVERLSDSPTAVVHPTAWPLLISAVEQAIAGGARFVLGSEWMSSPEHRSGPMILGNVSPEMRIAQADLFAPVLSLIAVENMSQAVELNRTFPYALSASIFGSSRSAEYWSRFISVGCVTINDLIAPTADPRVSFGGRAESGYGMTRGLEGLLELTRPKYVCTRRGTWLPHLQSSGKTLDSTLAGLLQLSHGGSLRVRILGLWQVIASLRKKPADSGSTRNATILHE